MFASGGSAISNGSYAQIKQSYFPNGTLPTNESQMSSYLVTIAFTNSAGVTKRVTVHKKVAAGLLEALTQISEGGYEIRDIGGYVWKNKTNSSSGARSSHSYGLAIDIVADCIDSGFDIMQGKHDEVPENIATGVNSIVFSLFNSTQDSYLTSVEFSNDIESVNELKGKTTPGNHPKVKKAATKGISHAGRSIGKKASREVVFGAAVDALKNGVNWLLKAIF